MTGSTGNPTGSTGTAGPDVDFVALRPGQMIGRYEIVAVLGQGGFGITYRACDRQLGRDVAMKEYLPTALAVRQGGVTVLPRSTAVADDFAWGRQRFVDEGRTLASLQHAPAIVQVFDFLEANGTAYIVMRLLPGDTLESRLKKGPLSPTEADRILWPLLDGLAQVHDAGFLHRDIKPANILLDAEGNPTLIDFGASRAAMAGRTTAMTAIFTPGYAAAEQMTSAKQGPWTDIYSVAATIHHAITGAPPPSAFERMLTDDYTPLATRAPAGFTPGFLIGIDAGLSVRATDRPQSITGWKTLLGQRSAPDANATVALGRAPRADATVVVRTPTAAPLPAPPPPTATRGSGLWVGLAVAIAVVVAGGGYYAATRPTGPDPVALEAARQQQAAADAEAARQKARDEELARLKADAEARQKADAEADHQRQVAAEEQRQRNEARERGAAAEAALKLAPVDRQRVRVALTALGFSPGGMDGPFGQQTREAISAWQKSKGEPETGYVSGAQNQALLRDAAPAIARFDEAQRKAEEDRRKAAAAAAAPPPATAAPATPAPAQPVAPAKTGPDGNWAGKYHCTASRAAPEFTQTLILPIVNGSGTWIRPTASGEATRGNQSINIKVVSNAVVVTRTFIPSDRGGASVMASLQARYDGANAISGGGPEHNSNGRICDIHLTRSP